MTRKLTEDYFRNGTFYQIQSGALIDNPDQRISSDVRWGQNIKKCKAHAAAACRRL